MKNYLTFVTVSLLLIFSVSVRAQSPFSNAFYDSLGIEANAMAGTFDNGYMVAGEGSNNEGLILKMDSTGDLLWNKTFNRSEGEIFYDITPTNDSDFLLVGSTYDTARKLSEALCIKINSNGDTVWSKAIRRNDWNITVLSDQQTFDSGYILTGYAENLNFDSSGIFVAKLDAKGRLQWTNIIVIGNHENIAATIKQTPDSGYIIIGTAAVDYNPRAILLKLSLSGNISWVKKYKAHSSTESFGNDLEITNDGFLCYFTDGFNMALMKTDLSGNVLWAKLLGGFIDFYCFDCPFPKFRETHDKGFVFVSGSPFNGEIIKSDSAGNLIWASYLELNALDVLESRDKGLFILGNGPLEGELKQPGFNLVIGIIKTDSLGNGVDCVYPAASVSAPDTLADSAVVNFTSFTGGVAFAIHPSVSSVSLITYSGCVPRNGGIHKINSDNGLSVYPNPSSGQFTLTSTNTIIRGTLEIYKITGEKIFEENIASESKMEINLHNVSPGIYIIKVIEGNGEGFEKLIIQ